MNQNPERQIASCWLKKLFKPRKERTKVTKGTDDAFNSGWKSKDKP